MVRARCGFGQSSGATEQKPCDASCLESVTVKCWFSNALSLPFRQWLQRLSQQILSECLLFFPDTAAKNVLCLRAEVLQLKKVSPKVQLLFYSLSEDFGYLGTLRQVRLLWLGLLLNLTRSPTWTRLSICLNWLEFLFSPQVQNDSDATWLGSMAWKLRQHLDLIQCSFIPVSLKSYSELLMVVDTLALRTRTLVVGAMFRWRPWKAAEDGCCQIRLLTDSFFESLPRQKTSRSTDWQSLKKTVCHRCSMCGACIEKNKSGFIGSSAPCQ